MVRPDFDSELGDIMIEHICKACIAVIFAVAVLGSVPASAALSRNGAFQNGIWQNGIWQNGIWQNGIWQNGIWQNGVGAKRPVPARKNAAGELVIDSHALVSVELPR